MSARRFDAASGHSKKASSRCRTQAAGGRNTSCVTKLLVRRSGFTDPAGEVEWVQRSSTPQPWVQKPNVLARGRSQTEGRVAMRPGSEMTPCLRITSRFRLHPMRGGYACYRVYIVYGGVLSRKTPLICDVFSVVSPVRVLQPTSFRAVAYK